MTKILNFHNQGGTFNDNSESVITISPQGTKVEQHLQVTEPQTKGSTEKQTGQLTISQQVLLFSELLGVSLEPDYGNQAQLADFIAKVTRGNPDSIRQKVMEIAQKGKSGDYSRQIKRDAEKVAQLIEPLKPKLARNIRDFYLDN